MPIKFRCEHCQQLLGISRTKAGQVADCPTCGRSVRVPELDGRRQPVPPPELNLKDSRLAGALDELAQIGLEPEGEAAVALPLDQTSQKAEIITRDPLPNPVPIETAPLVEPRDVHRTGTSASASSPVATKEALAELARGTSRPAAMESPAAVYRRRRWKSNLSLPVAGLLAAALAAGFGIGYLAGNGGRKNAPAAGNGTTPAEAHHPAGNGNAAAKPAVKGRITYKNDEGDRRPDRKARVLVFPQERVGQRKLDVIGLRAGDSEEDFRSAAAALRALGGDVTLVDDDGGFEISLPAAGTYQILVLSSYKPRDADAAVDAPLMNQLSAYFDRPQQLLGQVAWHAGQVRYKGAEPVLWDHSF